MKKLTLMILASFVFSSMVVMVGYAGGTGDAMSSDEDRTYGVSPEYGEDFNLPSDQGTSFE